jgi:16S rRNA (cytosine967-C5)-methyltransferase
LIVVPAARLSAAIEILSEIDGRRRPAADSLKDWGVTHRFAGATDRALIADLVYDALRVRASSIYAMGQDTARAMLIGALRDVRKLELVDLLALFSGSGFAPPPLDESEQRRFRDWNLTDAPPHVLGNYPEWLEPSFAAAFGEQALEEGKALARRAPLDLRVNTLKGDRLKAQKALAHLHCEPTTFSPVGLRIAPADNRRTPAMTAEPAFFKGLVEVQDEGSQLAVLLSKAGAGEQVLDLCAGGGGKSLALAALMGNRGQIYAYDRDGRRLMPAMARLSRAGARNIQLRAPRAGQDVLSDLSGRCDLVFVDAPCTGSGTWRRNPDAKWRIRSGALAQRVAAQRMILAQAAGFTKSGGRIVYVTCSLLCEENEDRVKEFLAEHPQFDAEAAETSASRADLTRLARFASPHGIGLRLSPRTTETDGFFVSVLRRH